MTFEYRDAYGNVLTANHVMDHDDNPMAVLWVRGEYGVSIPVHIPADRVEEVIAGIRDAARTAAARQTADLCELPHMTIEEENACHDARQTTGQDNTDTIGLCGYCGVPRENHHHGYVSTADAIAAAPHRVRAVAPAVGQPADLPLTTTDRQVLDFALSLAATAMAANSDEFTDADETALARLRRIAYNTNQPAETQGTDEARVRWCVKSSYPNGGTVLLPGVDDRGIANSYLDAARESSPEATHRLVRETTTWTVEDKR